MNKAVFLRASVLGLFMFLGLPAHALPPVASPPSATLSGSWLNEDHAPFGIGLSGIFTDPEGQLMTYAFVSSTGDAIYDGATALNPVTGLILFDPAPNASGTQTLVFSATDTDTESGLFTITLVVPGVNDEPDAEDDNGITIDELDIGEDGSVVIDVLANDEPGDSPTIFIDYGMNWPSDLDPQYTNVSESEPTTQLDEGGVEFTVPNGTLSVNPDNTISYSPKPNFSGPDWFEYTIQDVDGETSTARVDIMVVGDNDPPRVWGNYTYTVDQGSFLDVEESLGLFSQTIDDDGDDMLITVIDEPVVGTLTVDDDTGAFQYFPPGSYGEATDPPVTFTVQYNDLPIAGDDSSAVAQVTINFNPDSGPPEPDPPGEVSQIFDLADVPLENAVSAESNVLVVMDDSGSMDWSIMVPGPGNMFNMNNAAFKEAWMPTRAYNMGYTHRLATNQYDWWYFAIPTEESLAAHPNMTNQDYGVWRAWNAQYNPIYYDPTVYYEPWTGLARNGQDFPDATPNAAVLDPFDVNPPTVDLTAENLEYISWRVPSTNNDADGWETITNTGVHMAHYYTTTAAPGVLPTAGDMGERIDIRSNYTLNNGVVLTSYPGGEDRADCAVGDDDPNTCTYEQEIQNFANWFVYYRSREYTAKAALGTAIAGASNLRMGYTVLNKTAEREEIESLNASYRVGQKKDLLDQMYAVWSGGGTPLRQALDRAGRTFECASGNAFFTAASDPGDANCPVLDSPQGQCQNNFTLLFSDGEWNGSFSIANHDRDSGGVNPSDTLFDGGKYEGTDSSTLADVAMYYYERDLHPDLADGVSTTERDQNGAPVNAFLEDGELMHQHMKTYTVGFGLEGNFDIDDIPTDFNTAFPWENPTSSTAAKIDDMLHAAVNGRGQFLQANNPVLLTEVFQNVFEEFSDSSVSVSAVAFNSTSLREDTVEYRGFFNPKFHNGDLLALSVNSSTGVVDVANPIWRSAVQLDQQTPASRTIVTYDDITGRGKPFTFGQLNADQLAVLNNDELEWIRGDRSDEEPNGTLRQREQTEGILGDIVHSAPVFVGQPRAFRRDQDPYPTGLGDLYSEFVADSANRRRVVYVGANDGMLHGFDAGIGASNGTGNELFAYVPNKIIDDSEFDANQLDQLTSIVYAHRFFVDLTPSLEDVYMHPSWAAASKEWTTLLVGGLGAGGKGYFAINATSPDTAFSTVANAEDAVLWEFTDEDDFYPVDENGDPLEDENGDPLTFNGRPVKDLGYSLAMPQLVMTNLEDSDGEQHWAAVFGNGYNSTAGIGKLFVLLVDEGYDGWQTNDVIKIDTGEGVKGAPDPQAGLPNGIGTAAVVDADGNGTADYAYAGDLFGNMWRFDMTSDNRLDWSATKIFAATLDGTSPRQMITTQPFVRKLTGINPGEPNEGFLVVFGTGSWVTDDDGTSQDIQSVYGIWDRLEVNPVTASPGSKNTRLVEQQLTNVVDTSNNLFERQRILSRNPVDYQPDGGGNPGVYGWYFDLDPVRPASTLQGGQNNDLSGLAPPNPQYPGERAIRRIVNRGETLLITTVIPRDANTCQQAPPGSTFPVDALTGGSPTRPIIDINNDGVIDDNDFVVIGGEQYASGILFDADDLDGTIVDPSMLVGSGDHDFLFISGGDDQITLKIAPPEDQKTGRLSWRQLIEE